ncbi:nucleotide exchange factor GrpE [Teredinibacter waterburyi]|uniref:nucleotide exchange factor GrpE n=1 Tax=Teredinibacter waterburyi TaxID=1500538 RepID=UPI00165FF758
MSVIDDKQTQNEAADGLDEDQVTLDAELDSSGEPQPASEQASDREELLATIARLEQELQDAKEQVLRTAAEAQNVRRRAEMDVEKAHKFGVEKFVSDMLPVADNLVRAVDAASAEGAEMSAVIEGVELTLKSLMDGLKRHNVETVNPEGEPFDPQLHQAMTAVPQPDVEPNTVINVFQCGYTLHGRLVRPAMVVVSKAPE